MKQPYIFAAVLLFASCNFSDGLENNEVGRNNTSNSETDNNTAGNNTAGNNTAGNNTAGNNTAGNNTAGNNTTNNTPGEIWQPAPGTTWQWQIDGTIDTSFDVEMYDIDLFDASQGTIDQLHADGRIVVCYFSAGTYEDWRDDAGDYDAADYGSALPDWPGEYYVDLESENVRSIIEARLDLAQTKGCDGVEPDNVDTWDADSGFEHTQTDQLDFNRFLSIEAHERGLSIGLKNALGLVGELEPDFDWALNEECLDYDECSELQPFLDAGKAVFHTEYVDDSSMGAAKRDAVCADAGRPTQFSTLIKTWDLDAWSLACD